MKRKFTLKLFLGIFLVLTALTVTGILSFAQPAVTEVSNEAELRAAIQAGGNVKLTSNILLGDVETGTISPILVQKDVVLDLNACVIEVMTDGSDSIFTVSGASLTVNGNASANAFLGYNGLGSIYKLVGVEGKATTLTVNGGSHNARQGGSFENPDYPAGIIVIEAAEGTVTPTAEVYDGTFSCQNSQQSYFGPIVSGKTDGLTVKGGTFNVDPAEYVPDNYAALRNWDNYVVLEIATEYSEKFQSFLDEDGKFVLNYYQPEEGESLDPLFEALGMIDPSLNFYTSTLDETEYSVYVSLCNPESGEILETHKVYFAFQYDPAIRELVQDIMDDIPEDPMGMTYYFTVKDMELINYWSTLDAEREYTGSLMQYSGEFREFVNYQNFSLDPRMGWDTPFYTEYAGIGNFSHNGTVYGMKDIGVKAQHIIYVPDDTPDTRQDLIDAAQVRINAYLGENSGITVSYADTAEECYYRWAYVYDSWMWEEEYPDLGYEEWKQSSYFAPVDDDTLEYISGIEGITTNDDCFQVVINGISHNVFIVADSSNMVSPICKTADAKTNITVSANDSSLPLDTMIQVEKLADGTEYEEIMEILNVEENETFDIKLHSQSLDQYVTTLENGNFEVRIPLSSEWQNADDLVVYYVDENQQIETYDVTPTNDGWAVFETDHFSIYTLAERTSPDTNSDSSNTNQNTNNTGSAGSGNTDIENPPTADGAKNTLWFASLMVLGLTATGSLILLRRKSQ